MRESKDGSRFAAVVVFALILASSLGAAPKAWVVNNGSPFLTVVDLGTRQQIGSINVGNAAAELLILPDNRYALLTEYADNTLRKIDLRAGASVTTVPLGTGPASQIASRDSRVVYVANEGSNDVSVVDIVTMAETKRIPVGTTPIQVNQRPDGKYIYAVNRDSNSVSVIDTATLTVAKTVDLPAGSLPNQFAVHPSGQRAFIANPGGNSVSVFDLNTNTVTGTLSASGGPGIVAFSPNGARIFVLGSGSNVVHIFNYNATSGTATFAATFTVGAQPTSIAVTFDGLYAYVACRAAGTVVVADLSILQRIDTHEISTGTNSQPFTVAFDGNEDFVFATLVGSNEIAVISTTTDQIVSRIPTSPGTLPTALVQLNQPWVYPGGVVNGASFKPGAPVAGAAIVSLFGEGLVAEEGFAQQLPLPNSINGTEVRFNGILAPLFYAGGLQINAQVPVSLLGAASAQMQVSGPNGIDISTVSLASTSPGLFSVNSSGQGPGAILHDDSVTPVSDSNPARPGETIVIYATGLGATNPAVKEGQPGVAAQLTNATVSVTVGGRNATVAYAGLAPGFAGLYQVNAQLPADMAGGSHPVIVRVNGVDSNAVTVAVR